jgi:hypothetical protein
LEASIEPEIQKVEEELEFQDEEEDTDKVCTV